jgi:hypothetical protein
MQLFRRTVSLEVIDVDANESITIEKLQVEFDITRTLEREPSVLVAKVFNLSDSTRAKLEDPADKTVTLNAGYGETLHTLFHGDLRTVKHSRDGADIVTTIEAGDGEKGSKNWVRKWFPKNTSTKSIFDYLISKAGIGEGNVNEALDIAEEGGLPDEIRQGLGVRGYALDELSELCIGRGIDFSVQGGEAQFLPVGDYLQGVPVTQVQPGTGLIGSPTVDNEGIMTCTILLRPNVFPGSRLDVKSEFVSGRFKVTRCEYTGSVFGPDFSITVEGKDLS